MRFSRILLVLPLVIGLFVSCSEDSANEPQRVTLSGVIQKASDGTPLAGAEVIALQHEGGEELARAVSDSGGHFALYDLPAVMLDLLIEAQGYAPVHMENMDPAQPPEALRNLAITMEGDSTEECCDGVLTVIVRDPQNQPILGALVRVWKDGAIHKKTWTDSSGIAVLQDLCGGEYGVDVTKDDWTDREFTFGINENCDPVTKEVTMERLGCCDGVFTLIVRDGNGDPVEGAKVQVRKGMKTLEDPRTDANGRIVVDGLCEGEYNYRVSKEGYKVVEGVFAINESCDPVTKEVTMERLGCCDGVFTLIVRDGNGDPVEGAKVLVRKGSKAIEDPRTDANGRIVVDGLCEGEYNYRISKEGFKVVEGVFSINANCDPVTKEATLETNAACCTGVLTVTVVDSTSTPIQNAIIRLWKDGAMLEKQLTGSDGKAVFDHLCAGSYGVDVEKAGLKAREFMFSINENCDPYSKTIELLP